MAEAGQFPGFGRPPGSNGFELLNLASIFDKPATKCVDIARVSDMQIMTMAAPAGVSSPLWAIAGPGGRRALWNAAEGTSGMTPIAGASPPAGAPTSVTADQIRTIMPNAGGQADQYADALNSAMTAHGITAPEQRAAFLAQIAVESGDLNNTSENLNYSAQRLTHVWPRRFPNVAAAAPYAHNPEALGNRTYADRLGNGDEASGDGYRYRGRGLMQVTGRDNYRRLGFEDNPDALANPITAADTAATFWANNNLNGRTQTALDRAHYDEISRAVNGGDNGISERWAAYQRALAALQPTR